MNMDINFQLSPQFKSFKRAINRPDALELLFALGCTCQVKKATQLELPAEYIPATLGFEPEDTDPQLVHDALVKYGFIVPLEDSEALYEIKYFIDNNARLIASWKNGWKNAKPKPPIVEDNDEPVPF